MTLADLKTHEFDKDTLTGIPARIACHYSVFPLSREGGKLRVAVSSEAGRQLQEELRVILGIPLECVPMPRTEIDALIQKFYGVGAGVVETLVREKKDEVEVYDFEVIDRDKKEDATISRLVNELIMDALRSQASDIHIEPFEQALRIRHRVDGLLREAQIPEKIKALAPSIISRIKIMAKLDIGEKRVPQDGRIKIRQNNSEIDLRISVLPSCHGEAIVIRILKSLSLLSMEQLGFESADLESIRKQLRKPNGIILMTGPTGSGKTTTLYACLKELNEIERKIITIEDPVEYKLPGIVQMQVNQKTGFTFAAALRSMLRHDPDCMMVGEIRDLETAEIAFRSALTGHLVFSTLHTNDAPSAVTRLIEMGIEPYLVASSLEAVIAQRLARTLCTACEEKKRANCARCGGTGYAGRTVVYEILNFNPTLRDAISEKKNASSLRRLALEGGMQSFFQVGSKKVKKGVTSCQELERIVSFEE